MQETFSLLSQIGGFECAWIIDTRGKISARTPSLVTDEAMSEMSTLTASLIFMYQKNNEVIDELSFTYPEHQVWIKHLGSCYLCLMTLSHADPAEIQSFLARVPMA